jgi:hypothetical protein
MENAGLEKTNKYCMRRCLIVENITKYTTQLSAGNVDSIQKSIPLVKFRGAKNIVLVYLVRYLRDCVVGWGIGSTVRLATCLQQGRRRTMGDVGRLVCIISVFTNSG